jgi:hypothetical protein
VPMELRIIKKIKEHANRARPEQDVARRACRRAGSCPPSI